MNLKKDVDHNENMMAEAKEVSHREYTELTRLKEISFNLDKDLDAQKKRVDYLSAEAENNDHRIN